MLTVYAARLSAILDTGASVNFYMFHGGTNFGFMAGANEFQHYKADVTSYGTLSLLSLLSLPRCAECASDVTSFGTLSLLSLLSLPRCAECVSVCEMIVCLCVYACVN